MMVYGLLTSAFLPSDNQWRLNLLLISP